MGKVAYRLIVTPAHRRPVIIFIVAIFLVEPFKRRKLAEMLAAEGAWDFEWCVAACEAEGSNLDRAREWLVNWAPVKHQAR